MHVAEEAEDNKEFAHRRFREVEAAFEDRTKHNAKEQHVNQFVAKGKIEEAIAERLEWQQRDKKIQTRLRLPEEREQKGHDRAEIEGQRDVLFKSKMHGLGPLRDRGQRFQRGLTGRMQP